MHFLWSAVILIKLIIKVKFYFEVQVELTPIIDKMLEENNKNIQIYFLYKI